MVKRVISDDVQDGSSDVLAMTAEDLRSTLSGIFGSHGWQKAFSDGTGIGVSTIQRYLNGSYQIPRYVEVLVTLLATVRKYDLPVPEQFNSENAVRRRRTPGKIDPRSRPDPKIESEAALEA